MSGARRIEMGRRSRLSRLALALGATLGAALVVFHIALFARRIEDLSILQPAVALQWLGTLFLLGFLGYLRRQRVSLFAGRSSLAFWLLVLLLHLVPGTPSTLLDWEHADLLLALPTTWLLVATLLLAALRILPGATIVRPAPSFRLRRTRRGPPTLDPSLAPRLFARPPPSALPV